MANTFELIASSIVGSGGATSIDFTSIPATYTDLLLKVSVRQDSSDTAKAIVFRLNNDSGSNYSARMIYGTGSGAASATTTTTSIFYWYSSDASATASTFNNAEVYIPDYTSSNQKSLSFDSVSENNGTLAYANLTAGLWTGTSAINRITLTPFTGATNFVQYSTAYLYGIKNS
jgi:hypothetical protein